MSSRRFQALVDDALEELPEFVRAHMSNVEVVVRRSPTWSQRCAAGVGPDQTLLGLYEGVPLTKRDSGYVMVAPDLITLFQQAIEDGCDGDPRCIAEQIRHTVMHELAHHFGISDEEMLEWGVY